jgi:hypothetical protein
MSWTADRTTIVNGLPAGYVVIPENNEPETMTAAQNHKYYSLKLVGVADQDYQASDVFYYSHLVKMRVLYRAVDGTQLITNEGLAMTLMQTISGIAGFHMFEGDPFITELDNKHIVFEMVFHFGNDDNE